MKCLKIYKIINIKSGLFKAEGKTDKCNSIGKSWYKLGDVKKAYNLVENKEEYKIVSFVIKIKDIQEEK